MNKQLKNKYSSSFRKDFLSGVIVFLIALPLCLGIAQASNAPLFSGIIAGVVGGIVIGFFSKSVFSVSGPAAGLVAIVVGAIEELKAFDIFLMSVVLSGVFQLIFGMIKAGTIANFFPTSVIEGMLAGIGITIIFKQIPDAFGYNGPDNIIGMRDGERGMSMEILNGIADGVHWGALFITIVCLALLILWQKKAFKKLSILPAGLVVVLIGTLLNILFHKIAGPLHLKDSYLVQLAVPTSARDFLHQFQLPDFSALLNPAVWTTALVIAVVASIETLLCIEATDKLDPLKRNTPGNHELKAQGLGNIVSGLIGGLPITSVIVRSSANINAGATSKRSTIIHGVLLLLCVSLIPSILNLIPKASLAAILIFTGYKLAKPSTFLHIYKVGPTEFIPFVVTAVAVALPFLGLLKGVALGMFISIFYLLRSNMRIPYFYQRIKTDDSDVTVIKLAQEVSFLNKGAIKKTLEQLPDGAKVIIDASDTEYIDFDVQEVIREFFEVQSQNRDISVQLTGFRNIYKIPESTENIMELVTKIKDEDSSRSYSGKAKKLMLELEKENNRG